MWGFFTQNEKQPTTTTKKHTMMDNQIQLIFSPELFAFNTSN